MLSIRSLLVSLLAITANAIAQDVQQSVHFKPASHALGDVHPFFHEGECFLYYLKPGKYESALVRSKDWLHWSETTITHDATKPADWMSPYFVLGVFQDSSSSLFRSFFGHAQGLMASSESPDLLRWSCAPQEFHIPTGDYYQRRRDPFVFWIPELKQYGCVMTTWMKGRPKETGGAVSLATSADLKHWQDHGPILDPGTIGEPECPQMFSLGGRWYLLASIYDRAVGQPSYWTSTSPLGPWPNQPTGVLDGKDLCAAQIAFNGKTPVLFGWIPLTPAKPGSQHWGGHLALPREVHVLPDGALGTRLPEEIAKIFKPLPLKPVADGASRVAAEFTLTLRDEIAPLKISLAPLGEIELSRNQIRILDAKGECWSELPVSLSTTQQLKIQLLVEDNIVELFVNARYSLATRLPEVSGPIRLRF